MIVEWSESRLTSISRNQFESPIILGCWQSSDRNGTRTMYVFSFCLLASIIASLRTLSLNLDILKFLRRHFYIQDVPLGQCLHHFEFFLLSVPPWLFSTPNRTQHPLLPSFRLCFLLFLSLLPSIAIADLFSRDAVELTRWRAGSLWFFSLTRWRVLVTLSASLRNRPFCRDIEN